MQMSRNNIPLGRILGIPIGVDYSWFLIFALLSWMLAVGYYPAEFKDWPPLLYWLTGLVTAIMLFVSVLLHELGHSVIAMRYNIPVRSIRLFIFGGVAQIGAEPPSPRAEFLIAIAGPFVSLILAAFFYLAQPLIAGFEPLLGLAKYLAYINLALVLFNLIPGFPLDGGRVFRAIVWALTGNLHRSTIIAANVGRFFAFMFIFVGIWQMFYGNIVGGIWIAFIGWFLDNAAATQLHQINFQDMLVGHYVSQAMATHYTIIPENLTLEQLVAEHIPGSGQRYFLVNHGDTTVGVMTLHRMENIPSNKWARTSISQVMIPIDQLTGINPDTELWTALEEMDHDGVSELPVCRDHHVVGILSREDVTSFLRSLQKLGKLTKLTTEPR